MDIFLRSVLCNRYSVISVHALLVFTICVILLLKKKSKSKFLLASLKLLTTNLSEISIPASDRARTQHIKLKIPLQ